MEDKSLNNSSLVMDTSATDAFDLTMYLDVMDELCRAQINPKTITEVTHITEEMAKLCRENQSETNNNYHMNISATNQFFLNKQQPIKKTNSLCTLFDDFDPCFGNEIDNDDGQILDELKDVFAYFDEDVQSTCGTSTTESVSPDIENKENIPIMEKFNRSFKSKVKTVKDKSKGLLNTLRNTNRKVGRLRGSLINLFEEAKTGRNISEPRSKIRKTDSQLTIDRNNNYAVQQSEFKIPAVPTKTKETVEEIEEQEKQFFRQHSKRKFEESRRNLESFFNDKIPHCENDDDGSNTTAPSMQSIDGPAIENDYNNMDDCMLNKFMNKLSAIETFVQTQQFLQRIRYLVKAITKLDETRMTTMNLERLRNFLIFIRDCSNDCQNVCADISEYILSDLENCSMTQKELYYYLTAISLKPPENELQKSHDNNVALSEHQLRVQASLQRLNIPEWYRQYSTSQSKQPGDATSGGGGTAYVPGSFTKKRNSDIGRWTGLNSKTTSLSSLGSQRSDRSPLLLSPSAHSHHGQTGFSRWSTSHLNSSQTSPSASVRSSFSRGGTLNASTLSGHSSVVSAGNASIRNSFRQPYMGWRSQEKLAQPRTPAERLASSLLARQQNKQEQHHQQQHPQQPAVTPEIQSSIKEVTSAIVHYVNDQTNRTSNSRSRSTSPTTRKCWLESSFVGNRPLDSPQTPVIESSFTPRSSSGNTAISSAALQSARMNGVGESKLV